MHRLAPSKITALVAVRDKRLTHLASDSKRAHGYFIFTNDGGWVTTRKANQPTYRFLEENGYIEVGEPGAIQLAPVKLTKKGRDAIKDLPKSQTPRSLQTVVNTVNFKGSLPEPIGDGS